MLPARLLVGLLQATLAVLLFAGTPASERARSDGSVLLPVAIEVTLRAIDHSRERGRADHDAQARADLDRLGDGADPDQLDALLGNQAFRLVPDRAYLIRVGRTSYPTAPPSYRPCAAPPTGPPLA